MEPLRDIIESYDPAVELADASTIPAPWYIDPRVHDARAAARSSRGLAGRGRAPTRWREPGQYVTAEVAGRADRRGARRRRRRCAGFFNVCRHHAAAVVDRSRRATAHVLRCPYHGWTYALDGALKGTPDFAGVCDFDRAAERAACPSHVGVWENFVFVRARCPGAAARRRSSGRTWSRGCAPLGLAALHCARAAAVRARLQLEGVRRQLPGRRLPRPAPAQGPRQRPRLRASTRSRTASATACSRARWSSDGAERGDRRGAHRARALYYWLYPNFMINWYEGAMDTNLVVPLGVDRTRGDLRLLLRRRLSEAGRDAQPRQHRGERAHPGRGPRASASRSSAACGSRAYHGRPPVGAPRGRRAPVPPSAGRRPAPLRRARLTVSTASPCPHSVRGAMSLASSGGITRSSRSSTISSTWTRPP